MNATLFDQHPRGAEMVRTPIRWPRTIKRRPGVIYACSRRWTGNSGETLIDVMLRYLYSALYPTYGCEGCIGQEGWMGCYCAHYGAVAPGEGPGPIRFRIRILASRLIGAQFKIS